MMATGDNAMQLLVQKLKQRFPEIPEDEVYACVQQSPYDLHQCEQRLSLKSPRYMYGPFSELAINVKPEQELSNHSSSNHHVLYQHQSSRYSGSTSINRQNGDNMSVSPRYHNSSANYNQPMYDPRVMGSLRSASVSGMSPPVSSTTGYQSGSSASVRHPKSAPVMPNQYEPFQSYDRNTHGQFYSPSNSTSPMSMPPGGVLPHYAQQGMYHYEMRVSYQAQVTKQRAQMDRLHRRLLTDKQKLDTLKLECASMEKELSKRTRTTHSILPHEEIQKLKAETSRLRVECDTMSREVDAFVKGKVPLGETSELKILKHINPGPPAPVELPQPRLFRSAPPLPFPPMAMAQPSSNSSDEEGHQWSCSTCTFLNNPALDKCEICEMPRIMLGMPHTHSSVTIQSGPCYCHRQTVP